MSDAYYSPCPAPFNLAQYVLCNAGADPSKSALEVLGEAQEHWSFGALENAVRGVATGLFESGLKPGDIVMLRLGNTPDFPIAYLGAIAAGMIACPTSSALNAREIKKMAATIRPSAVLLDDAIAAPDILSSLTIPLTDLRSMYDLPSLAWHMSDPERAAYMVFTSGTSGTPRAVVHAHRAIWARKMMLRDWSVITSNDRMLHAGAFNWTYTLGTGLMDPWSVGATALIPQDGTSIDRFGELIADHKASIFAAAPGVYRKMLKQDLPKFTHLRHVLSAGEKMAPSLHESWERATGTNVYEAFGMSECSTFISSNPDKPAPVTALGKPQRGRRVSLRNKEDNEVQRGQVGEISIHRSDPGLMLGYFNLETGTHTDIDDDWFQTGDLGHEDTAGMIHYDGRNDDMLNAGGFRVSPLEIEAAFHTVDTLTHCAAIEIRLKADTSVIALCYCASNVVHESTLHALATDMLARYKRPRIYHQCDTLPLSANGKLLRRVLRSQIEALYGQA